MKKIISKVEEGKVLHLVHRKEDIIAEKNNLVHEKK